jgi:hypothetical protein
MSNSDFPVLSPRDWFTLGGGDASRERRMKWWHKAKLGMFVHWDLDRERFTGLPAAPPDTPVTTLAVELNGEPRQDTDAVRKFRKREQA